MSKNSEDVVFEFLKAVDSLDYGATRQAFMDYCAEDFRWVQCGLPTMTSRAETIGLLDAFRQKTGFTGFRAETITWAARDESVLVERIDHCTNDKGDVFLSWPVVGVFQVREDKIVEWHEYMDPRGFLHMFELGDTG